MFSVFAKTLTTQYITDDEANKVNWFIYRRWLSGDPRTLPYALAINDIHVAQTPKLLRALQSKLNKLGVRFIRYIKTDKTEVEDDFETMLNYRIGTADYTEYIKMLDELQRIEAEAHGSKID